jgi:hypothetical protein
VKWKVVSVRLEIVLILMHDRCTICAHPMVLLGDVGQAEARFGPFGDSVNSAQDRYMVCAECTMGMEII